jgi:KDO2-lipid IV(A) lauroyltransferase
LNLKTTSTTTAAVREADYGATTPEQSATDPGAAGPLHPSSFYRSELWRLGIGLARILPHALARKASTVLAALYVAVRRARREVVIQNVLPAVNGNRTAAEMIARRMFQNFGVKLVDLWRYESGKAVSEMFTQWTGWEHLQSAQRSGRGVLLLTPHLGNWEFGAPLLAERGVKLVVITLDEPHQPLTALRQSSRARRGIETIVIGRDTFAFVEVIRRLEEGGTVALLVDRPPGSSAVGVELFGRRFLASIAGAELARASGCALLPVHLPRTDAGYAAHILPEVPYERASLRSPDARQRLTQATIHALEPAIRAHIDQWYHFVPLWPKA